MSIRFYGNNNHNNKCNNDNNHNNVNASVKVSANRANRANRANSANVNKDTYLSLSPFFIWLVLPVVLVFIYGCSEDKNFCTKEQSRKDRKNVFEASRGMQINVRNSLPDLSQGTPDLNAFFCCPVVTPDGTNNSKCSSIPTQEGRCVRLDGVVKNGEETNFLVNEHDLKWIYNLGNGYGRFYFKNQFESTLPLRGCWDDDHGIQLGDDFGQKQVWRVEVDGRHTKSYTCRIYRTK